MKEKKNDDTIKESAKKAEEAENTQEDTKEASQETSAAEEYVQPEETEEPEEASKEEEYLQLAQRIQADFDNYRKRNASLRADAMADGKAEAVKSFLERALQTERENGTAGTLMEGLEMVLKQMAQALKELGVEEIEAQGLPFDPACHNAVMQVPCTEEQKPGTVAAVFAKGYKIDGRIIRYSMVQVTI